MSYGFIIIRHVINERTDNFWKECYSCIRKFYKNPILIIDDSSNNNYLKEDIELENCTTIYDTEHVGCGEALPYYYFYKLHPFDTAIILHDSVFIQKEIDFTLDNSENVRILWSFYHYWDDGLLPIIDDMISDFNFKNELLHIFHQKNEWLGCFGTMSVIKWNFMNVLQEKHCIFETMLNKIKNRDCRSSLERIFGMLFYYNYNECKDMFGNIHHYIKEGTTYEQYKSGLYNDLPIIKVWTGR